MIKPIDFTIYMLMMMNSDYKYTKHYQNPQYTTTKIITNDSLYNINSTLEKVFIINDAEEE